MSKGVVTSCYFVGSIAFTVISNLTENKEKGFTR